MTDFETDPGRSAKKGCCISCIGLLIIGVLALAALSSIVLRANRPPNIALPPLPKPPSPNAYDVWMRAAAASKGITPEGPYSVADREMSEWTVPELREFVRAHEEPLDLFHGSLSHDNLLPHSRDLFDFSPTSTNAKAALRALARDVAREAYYYERIGQPQRAAGILLDGLEMGARMPKGGANMDFLVGSVIQKITCDRLPGLLPRLDEDGLRTVIRRLEEIDRQRATPSAAAIEEARSMVFSISKMMRESPVAGVMAPTLIYGVASSTGSSAGGSWGSIQTALLGNKEVMLKNQLQSVTQAATYLDGPYKGLGELSRLAPKGPNIESLGVPWKTDAESRAVTSLIRTEAALRLYRMEHGRHPASLEELTPGYLDEVPIDWFGGKPLKYRPLNNGQDFLLYSVGANLKDEDGKTDPSEKALLKQPDIVLKGRKAQP